MDKTSFDEAAKRLAEVNAVIAKLDETIRPAAFELLQAYITGVRPRREAIKPPDAHGGLVEAPIDAETARAFLEAHYSDKPAENAKAIAALFYSRFGIAPFTAAEVADVAREAGVIVPARVDVTLGGASVDKKPLFTKVKPGVYKPTVHGEKYLKEVFGVQKGTQRRTESPK